MKVWDTLSLILKETASHVQPGITTLTLNNVARQLMKEHDVASCDLNYFPKWSDSPFPFETCICVNDEIVHGLPSSRKLQEGDLVNIDISIIKNGICADAALTVPVGEISDADKELLHYGKKALYRGIECLRDGVKVETIARAIEDTAWLRKYVVNASFTGHSIGSEIHQPPYIYHSRNPYYDNPEMAKEYQRYMNIELKAGQIICLEPAITKGDRFGVPTENGWTWKTRNKAKSVLFEEMIEVLPDGFRILTTHLKEEHEKYLGHK